jgi:hypothetical protein
MNGNTGYWQGKSHKWRPRVVPSKSLSVKPKDLLMPVRFTCRLIAVRTESGNLRVEYGPLGDGTMLVVFGQSRCMILPPEGELTDEEYERWKHVTAAENQASIVHESTPLNAPLVEAKRTYEDVIPPGSVRAVLRWARDQAGQQTLAVEVTNEWERPIQGFFLATVCNYPQPQPMKTGNSGIDFQVFSGTETMFTPMGRILGPDLYPRTPTGFALNPQVLPILRSRAASLSPEYHWIALLTDGYEFDRISGTMIAGFLDQAEE